MVHGNLISEPIDSYKKAFFCDEVFDELDAMRLNQIYRIQSYAWPHILHENSFIVVNSADTGKTLCYVPALCTLAKVIVIFRHLFVRNLLIFEICLQNEREREEENGIGPSSIIICPSSVDVERTYKLCKRFLHKSSIKMNIIQAYGYYNKRKVYVSKTEGWSLKSTKISHLKMSFKMKSERNMSNHFVHLCEICDNFFCGGRLLRLALYSCLKIGIGG